MSSMRAFFQQLEQLRSLNQRVTLATLVNTQGMSPRKEGAKMWVAEGGQLLGSVTIGGCVDAQVIEQSEDVLTRQTPCPLGMRRPGNWGSPVPGRSKSSSNRSAPIAPNRLPVMPPSNLTSIKAPPVRC